MCIGNLSINLITIVPDGIMSGLRPAPLFLAGPTADLPPPTPPPHPPWSHLHRHHRPQRSLRCNVLSSPGDYLQLFLLRPIRFRNPDRSIIFCISRLKTED